MAKSRNTSSAQGAEKDEATVVAFTVANATEKPNSVLITNEDEESYLISKDILFDNGIVNVKRLKGSKLTLQPGTKEYNGILIAKVIEDNLSMDSTYEDLLIHETAKLKAKSRFQQILDRGRKQPNQEEKEEDK